MTPVYTHYPLSVATIPLVPMQPWQDELVATVNKMLVKIEQPFDGSVSINLQITRKVVNLDSYRLEKDEAFQYKPASDVPEASLLEVHRLKTAKIEDADG